MKSVTGCFCLLIALSSARAGETWVFLKDGRLCSAELAGESLKGRLPDGASIEFKRSDIQGTRTPEQIEKAVDAMLAEMVRGKKFEEHAERFKTFRAAAVPPLLKHLKLDDINQRLSALYGLCFCWSADAIQPVLKAFANPDEQTSAAAYVAIERNVHHKELAELFKDFADDPDIRKAARVFAAVDPYFPDESLRRIKRLFATPEGRSAAAPRLSHYFCVDLAPGMLALLESSKTEEQRSAAVGLITARADGKAAREAMRKLLSDADADLRQVAAEYTARLGDAGDTAELKKALAKEDIPHVKAAFAGALRAIALRSACLANLPDTLSAEWSKQKGDAEQNLADCIYVLKRQPGKRDFLRARAVLGEITSEPQYWYAGGVPAWHEPHRLRQLVERTVLMAPCGSLEDDDGEEDALAIAPAADHLVTPINQYFSPQRRSFGVVPAGTTPFSNGVHVGDDCGWNNELRTVVSIGNGVVRLVKYIPSWGHLIVIEHSLKGGGRVCSLYGHLSAFIYVKRGESVEAGQKIGSIGRANSIENGGYGAHLHLGIHEGPFERDWIGGYVGKGDFAAGKHGWLNPQDFLNERK